MNSLESPVVLPSNLPIPESVCSPINLDLPTQNISSPIPNESILDPNIFPPLQSFFEQDLNPPKVPESNPWSKPPSLGPKLPKKINLRFIPPVIRDDRVFGVCSESAVAGELKILDFTLVGFFLGKRPSFTYVKAALLKQWSLVGFVEILQLHQGGFAFRFSELADRDAILERGVYYIGGQPLFLRQWERDLHSGGILGLKKIPLWVSLPGLPLHLWGDESLSAICSVLGNPLYSDSTTASKNRWMFARACVEFSAESPLLESVSIEDDVGNLFIQTVKYEWKPPHCLECRVFGHSAKVCPMKPKVDEKEPDVDGIDESADVILEPAAGPNESDLMPDLRNPLALDGKRDRDLLASVEKPKPSFQRVRVRKKGPMGLRGDLLFPPRTHAHLPPPIRSTLPAGQMSIFQSSPPGVSPCIKAKVPANFQNRVKFSKSPTCPDIPFCTPNPFGCLAPSVGQADLGQSDLVPHASPQAPHLELPATPSQPPSPTYSSEMATPDVCQPALSGLPSDGSESALPGFLNPKARIITPPSPCDLQTKVPPPTSPNMHSANPNPSSIGRTPYPTRVNTSPSPLFSINRNYSLPLRPFASSGHRQFRSITSDDLELMMAPAVNIMELGCPENDVEVTGKYAEDGNRMRKKASRTDPDRNQDTTLRMVESWEDLEESLRDPEKFFHNEDQSMV